MTKNQENQKIIKQNETETNETNKINVYIEENKKTLKTTAELQINFENTNNNTNAHLRIISKKNCFKEIYNK